ncbi:hypothetical protein GCM10022209_46270 [Chitinophaga oryziterrae]
MVYFPEWIRGDRIVAYYTCGERPIRPPDLFQSKLFYQFVYHKDYLAEEVIIALPGDNRTLFVK